ncbi:MAG: MarR family transcriptional regulator, partial [Sulfitobacter sp.]
ALFQRRLKAAGHDITPVQFSALQTLADHTGLDQSSLASLIAYDPATIGGVVKRLEQKGLIRRQPNEKDRRAFILCLTASGKSLLDDISPIVSALQADILSNLTGGEKVDFVNLLKKALHSD